MSRYSGWLGSVWDTYPYQVHATRTLGWQSIAFSKATDSIMIRINSCIGESNQDGVCKIDTYSNRHIHPI
jgi:hypothetical protein